MRYSIGAGSRAPLSTIGQRPPSASRQHLRAHEPQRIEDAAHRPLAQRGVAVEGRGDRRGRRRRPSSAGSRCRRCRNRAPRAAASSGAEAEPADAPAPGAEPLDDVRRAPGRPRRSAARRRPRAAPRLWSRRGQSPSMKARCEIDLSPGGRTRPLSGRARLAVSGEARTCDEWADTWRSSLRAGANRRAAGGGAALVTPALETVDHASHIPH